MNLFLIVTASLLEGLATTLKIFGLTLLMALPLGLIISFGSMSRFKPLKWVVKGIVWIVRGTPLMLQLVIFGFGPGLVGAWASKKECCAAFFAMLENWEFAWLADFIGGIWRVILDFLGTWQAFNSFYAVILAFVINYACYFSEIYRGGIEAIPKGQYEAGQVLGLTKTQVFFKVVLMQVVKNILPPMSNEFLTLVKDTALANTIMVYEITWNAKRFMNSEGILWPLFYSGAFYLVVCGILTIIFNRIEKKFDYYKT